MPDTPSGQPVPNLYALKMRERCAPVACTKALKCWVALGSIETLRKVNGTPRCLACGGEVRERLWQSPNDWAMASGLTAPKIID